MGFPHFGHFGRKGTGLTELGQQNCRLQTRHMNRCLPELARPYLLNALDPQRGQAALGDCLLFCSRICVGRVIGCMTFFPI